MTCGLNELKISPNINDILLLNPLLVSSELPGIIFKIFLSLIIVSKIIYFISLVLSYLVNAVILFLFFFDPELDKLKLARFQDSINWTNLKKIMLSCLLSNHKCTFINRIRKSISLPLRIATLFCFKGLIIICLNNLLLHFQFSLV